MTDLTFDITLLVNAFPSLSETFIFRKAIGLARRGHRIRVIASQQGVWEAFETYQPLPSTLTVIYPFRKQRTGRLQRLFAGLRMGVQHPVKLGRLARLAATAPSGVAQRVRLFANHLVFVGLETDLIHCEFLGIAASYPLLGALTGAPVVLSCRGADLHLLDHQQGRRADYIAQLQTVTAIHCVSEEMAQEVTRLSQRRDQVWVNRPAIEFERITPKSDYNATVIPLIVSVGRLVWKKGFDYLFNALYRLKQQGIAFEAEIIGDGKMRERLQMTLDDLGLTEQVRLVGPVPPDQVLQRLRSADVFALFSHEEGISNAVLEAMAVGLPVITTNAGGMTEAVRDGVEGYVVPVRDIAAFTQRLGELLQDAAGRQAMGEAARARVEAEFTIERQLRVFEQLYTELISSPEELK